MMLTKRGFNTLKLDATGINNETDLARVSALLQKIKKTTKTLELDHQADPTPKPKSKAIQLLKLSTIANICEELENLKCIKSEAKYHIKVDMSPKQLQHLSLSHVAMGAIQIVLKLGYLPVFELVSEQGKWILHHIVYEEVGRVDSSFFSSMEIMKMGYVFTSEGETIDDDMKDKFLIEVLEAQNKIEDVNMNVTDDFLFTSLPVFLAICKKTTLKKIKLMVNWNTTHDDMQDLSNLIDLEELTISLLDGDDEMLFDFMSVPLPSLKTLRLECLWPANDEIESELLQEMMSTNWPNIQELEGKKKSKLLWQ